MNRPRARLTLPSQRRKLRPPPHILAAGADSPSKMPPHTLASLAHALSAATDLDAAFVALAEGPRRNGSRSSRRAVSPRCQTCHAARARARGGRRHRAGSRWRRSIDQFPKAIGRTIRGRRKVRGPRRGIAGFRAHARDAARGRLGGWLSVIGLRVDGQLAGLIALLEPKRAFGTRVSERFGPMVSLFEIAFLRFAERDARLEAVRATEDITQKVHGDYLARTLAATEEQLPAGAQRSQAGRRAGRGTAGARARRRAGCRRVPSGHAKARRARAATHRFRRRARAGARRTASPQRGAPAAHAHALSSRSRAHARRRPR